MPSFQIKRGTKAQLLTAAASNDLKQGELYFLTDIGSLVLGKSSSTYNEFFPFDPTHVYRSGLDLTIANNQASPITQAQVAATLRAFPWKVRRALTLTAVRCEVTTSVAGTTFRLGLYADNGAAYPGVLVAGSDVGTLSSATAGVRLNTFAVPISLTPGFYWLVVNNSGAPTFRAVPIGAIENILGANPAGGTNAQNTAWSIAQTYAALPNPFPSTAALVANLPAPNAMFRVQ